MSLFEQRKRRFLRGCRLNGSNFNPRSIDMHEKKIYITVTDMKKLQDLIQNDDGHNGYQEPYLKQLKEELDKAVVVRPEGVPSDVITMNTEVKFRDLDTQETFAYRIVYPADANPETKYLSVLAPVGTALLGLRVNDTVEWPVPAGIRRLRIEDVLYQPEANGAFHL